MSLQILYLSFKKVKVYINTITKLETNILIRLSWETSAELLMETASALTMLYCVVYLHTNNSLKALSFLGDRSLLSLSSRKS